MSAACRLHAAADGRRRRVPIPIPTNSIRIILTIDNGVLNSRVVKRERGISSALQLSLSRERESACASAMAATTATDDTTTSYVANDDDHHDNHDPTEDGIGVLRRRSSPATTTTTIPIAHSFSESSFSRVMIASSSSSSSNTLNDDDIPSSSLSSFGGDSSSSSSSNDHHHFSFRGIASSTFFLKRMSCSSSLSWGHKPSPYIGASCLLYLLPVPFFLRACAYHSALLLLLVTVSSYMSDHVYTGIESYAHVFDRVLAPMAFTSCLYSTYVDCGYIWAASSLLAVKCHIWANYYARKGMYDEFVLWHCLWHGVGVGLIVVCYWWNDVVGSCWTTTTTTTNYEENAFMLWWLRTR